MIIHSPIISGSLTFAPGAEFTLPNGSFSGSFSGSITGIGDPATFSASLETKNSTLATYTGSVNTKFSTVGTYTASQDSKNSTLATYTGSVDTKFSAVGSFTASQDSKNSTLATYTGSIDTKNATLGTYTGSVNTKFSAVGTYTASQDSKNSTLATYTGSVDTTLSNQATKNSTLATYTGSIDTKNSTLATYTGSIDTKNATLATYTGSVNSSITNLNSATASLSGRASNLESFTSSFNTAIGLNGSAVTIKGDLLVQGTSTTVDSTTVRIGDNIIELNGSGATNGGIHVKDATAPNTATGSLLWDTTNDKWIAGALGSELELVTISGTQTLTNKTINGSQLVNTSVANAKLTNSTISGIALGSNLNTLTIGTGLSGTSYNGSSAVTIANTGVTSNVAGTAISVSGATGAVTITNTGVTSNVAGTGVTVSGATGAVTISIGQAVATSSNVQFNSLGVGMAASATAGRIDATNDIVAFSSSDIRFKENIQPIENPLEKISKISGNTYDWKEENKIEHGYEGNDVGVIAQEIEAVLPQLVQTRENGYKAVKYDKLVALLIEGIKEQQLQINDLKSKIEILENKL
jgi:hypothetical protein